MKATIRLTQEQKHVIKVVTFGGILEWFEIYSFVYLAPILGKLFFSFNSPLSNFLAAFLLFGIGLVSRPFGAIIFGRIGDHIGRKAAFMYSIVIMTIPTFLMGCLPTYASVGVLAPILFYFLRFLQSIPASGEMPGTICFLYENSKKENVNYVTSWTFVGNQIGAIVAIVETLIMDGLLSEAAMESWGWRVSFWTGGFIGLFGIYLRYSLMETPTFQNLKSHHHIDNKTVGKVINNYKKPIGIGIGFGGVLAASFYLYAIYIPEYLNGILHFDSTVLSWIMIGLIALMTFLLPFFGILADRTSSKKIFLYSSLFIIVLLPFLSYSLNNRDLFQLSILGILLAFPIAGLSAVYPYWIAHMFSSNIRYTSIGLAFNFADCFIGGLSPAVGLALLEYTRRDGMITWYVLFWAVVSVVSYFYVKPHRGRSI